MLAREEEFEYEFSFNIDHYIVIAQILLKIDRNLNTKRHELVPELIGEDDFWRNYFYRVEYVKKQFELEPTRLGPRIPLEQRERALKQRMENDQNENDFES